MRILIDTREQEPYTFTGYEAATETATLPRGDYSLPGFQDRAAIERKSLNDLIGCLMGKDRERFERELARGRHYRASSPFKCAIVSHSCGQGTGPGRNI
jgi:ERCC4-type nuclease